MSPIGFLDWSQSMRVTDRQTDGQNYDSQDRASIAASCSKNEVHSLEKDYRQTGKVLLFLDREGVGFWFRFTLCQKLWINNNNFVEQCSHF